MNIELLEPHPRRVLEQFRQGDFDGVEIIGRADEKAFFELCFRDNMLQELAQSMPTARKKEEVPKWFVLAANLSLRLHGEHAYHAFERVVRCGGLLSALDPKIASKHLDPEGCKVLIKCVGFNDKNSYDRRTPCDQDFLRKYVKDVDAQRWQQWFNGPVQMVFAEHGFFDPAGVFIGDASYLFVPDNPAYEGSVVMWFDEHNHPVDYEQLSPEQRKRAHRERCYKLVSLLHLRGRSYVYAALAVVPGNVHELPVLYQLVEEFVRVVGKGVIKLLILDRGFLDGGRIAYCKSVLDIDVLIPLKKKTDLWTDAWALARQGVWEEQIQRPVGPAVATVNRPAVVEKRERSRQQTLAQRKARAPGPDPATVVQRREFCAIKGFSWGQLPVRFNLALMRETYADGHQDCWGLMTTAQFSNPEQPFHSYGLRPNIEERHRQLKCFYDLTDFHSRNLNAVTAQVVFVLLSYSLRQWQLWKFNQERLSGLHPDRIELQLSYYDQHVVIYHQHAYAQIPLLSFSRELLEMGPEARAKALGRIRKLEKSLLSPPQNLPPP